MPANAHVEMRSIVPAIAPHVVWVCPGIVIVPPAVCIIIIEDIYGSGAILRAELELCERTFWDDESVDLTRLKIHI